MAKETFEVKELLYGKDNQEEINQLERIKNGRTLEEVQQDIEIENAKAKKEENKKVVYNFCKNHGFKWGEDCTLSNIYNFIKENKLARELKKETGLTIKSEDLFSSSGHKLGMKVIAIR